MIKRVLIFINLFFMVNSYGQEAKPPLKTILLQATGVVETMPDMATINIQVSCLEATAKAAKDCLVKQSNELNDFLLKSGIDEKDLLTTSMLLDKRFKWEHNKKVFEGYYCSTNTTITIRDLDALSVLYSQLLEMEKLSINGPNYTHSKMNELKNEAHANALNNANLLADRLLQELPESTKEVITISNTQINQMRTKSYAMESRAMDANVASQNVAINIGNVKVEARLQVEYLIK